MLQREHPRLYAAQWCSLGRFAVAATDIRISRNLLLFAVLYCVQQQPAVAYANHVNAQNVFNQVSFTVLCFLVSVHLQCCMLRCAPVKLLIMKVLLSVQILMRVLAAFTTAARVMTSQLLVCFYRINCNNSCNHQLYALMRQ
jgi:hypothetical protein